MPTAIPQGQTPSAPTDVAGAAGDAVYRWLFEHSLDGILLTRLDGSILAANPAMCRMLGYTADEIRALGRTGIVDATDPRLGPAMEERERTGRYVGELTLLAKDGRRIPVELSSQVVRDAAGAELTSMFVRDISARLAAQAELRRSEQRERFLAGAGELLASSLDVQSTIERIAHLAIPILGESCILDVDMSGAETLLVVAHVDPGMEPALRTLRERFPPAPDSPHPLAVVRRTGQPMLLPEISDSFLDAISMAPEQRRLLQTIGAKSSLTVPLVAGRRVVGVLTSFSTTRVLDEEDLSLAMELARRAALAVDNARAYGAAREATRVRDEVLGIVSHDLRNAVAAISMSADLLDAAAGPEQVARLGEQIMRATLWMRHLISDLVDVTALEAGRLYVRQDMTAASAIAEAVRAMHEPRARRRGVALRTEVEQLPPFRADADRIVQAVGNLLGNAIKFTPRGGAVTFAIERHRDGIAFRVTDAGPGIPAAEIPHLFDRFWQAQKTRRGGAGLGLAIAKGIADAHGGRIDVATAPGAGSTFTLVLPFVPARQGTAPPPPA